MTMKIDAAEVAKVFTDLKLPAAFNLSLTPKSLGPQSAFGFN